MLSQLRLNMHQCHQSKANHLETTLGALFHIFYQHYHKLVPIAQNGVSGKIQNPETCAQCEEVRVSIRQGHSKTYFHCYCSEWSVPIIIVCCTTSCWLALFPDLTSRARQGSVDQCVHSWLCAVSSRVFWLTNQKPDLDHMLCNYDSLLQCDVKIILCSVYTQYTCAQTVTSHIMACGEVAYFNFY